MDELRKALFEYNKITLELIDTLINEEYDVLENLFKERQNQIDKMNTYIYSGEQFSNICNELNVLCNQEQLEELMKKKRNYLKSEITKLSESKVANKSYSRRPLVDSLYLNKEI
ncbi:MAG: hypothetical protein H7Y18_19475 [Clostridiaceae bacterium]|nr:hypothetical protein [Clostridiaceae bacterium]